MIFTWKTYALYCGKRYFFFPQTPSQKKSSKNPPPARKTPPLIFFFYFFFFAGVFFFFWYRFFVSFLFLRYKYIDASMNKMNSINRSITLFIFRFVFQPIIIICIFDFLPFPTWKQSIDLFSTFKIIFIVTKLYLYIYAVILNCFLFFHFFFFKFQLLRSGLHLFCFYWYGIITNPDNLIRTCQRKEKTRSKPIKVRVKTFLRSGFVFLFYFYFFIVFFVCREGIPVCSWILLRSDFVIKDTE